MLSLVLRASLKKLTGLFFLIEFVFVCVIVRLSCYPRIRAGLFVGFPPFYPCPTFKLSEVKMFQKINEDLGWAWPLWLISLVLGGLFVYSAYEKHVHAHPPEDCFNQRTHPAQAVVLSPAKSSHKNPILGFQKRQLLKETGKWDKEHTFSLQEHLFEAWGYGKLKKGVS